MFSITSSPSLPLSVCPSICLSLPLIILLYVQHVYMYEGQSDQDSGFTYLMITLLTVSSLSSSFFSLPLFILCSSLPNFSFFLSSSLLSSSLFSSFPWFLPSSLPFSLPFSSLPFSYLPFLHKPRRWWKKETSRPPKWLPDWELKL